MPTLLVLSGLPGSGKSTAARRLLDDAREHDGRPGTAAVVSRDTVREHVFGLTMGPDDQILDGPGEAVVTALEGAMVAALLEAGVEVVIVDATHLTAASVDRWRSMSACHGAGVEVISLDVPVDECVRRDAARGAAGERSVGEQVIREIAARGAATWQDG